MVFRKSLAVAAACLLTVAIASVNALAHGGGAHGFGHGFFGGRFHDFRGRDFSHRPDAHRDSRRHRWAGHDFGRWHAHSEGHFGRWQPGHWHVSSGFGDRGHWSWRGEGMWRR